MIDFHFSRIGPRFCLWSNDKVFVISGKLLYKKGITFYCERIFIETEPTFRLLFCKQKPESNYNTIWKNFFIVCICP